MWAISYNRLNKCFNWFFIDSLSLSHTLATLTHAFRTSECYINNKMKTLSNFKLPVCFHLLRFWGITLWRCQPPPASPSLLETQAFGNGCGGRGLGWGWALAPRPSLVHRRSGRAWCDFFTDGTAELSRAKSSRPGRFVMHMHYLHYGKPLTRVGKSALLGAGSGATTAEARRERLKTPVSCW